MTPAEKKIKAQFPTVVPEYGKDLVRLLAGDTLLMVTALNGGIARAEGMVGRPVEALFDKRGHRLIVKLKTKDFAK